MQQSNNKLSAYRLLTVLLALAVISCVFVGESMAGGKKGGDDIILYNGNIILRGSGKGNKKGGSIVVANSRPGEFNPFGGI